MLLLLTPHSLLLQVALLFFLSCSLLLEPLTLSLELLTL
jgi:hypothetical protein